MRLQRTIYFLAGLFLSVAEAKAAPISGQCVDAAGQPVEYVSVGIRQTGTGTISDRYGVFTLRVPDSLMNRSLSFSHLSFEPHTVPLAEFSGAENAQRRIVLTPYAFALGEITVMPQKMKIVNLNKRGVRLAQGGFRMKRPLTDSIPNRYTDDFVPEMAMSLGTRIELGQKKHGFAKWTSM